MTSLTLKKRLVNCDTWCKIVWSLNNDIRHNNYAIAQALSMKSEKYEEDAFNKLWDNGRTGNTLGTFYHYAKESNHQKYNEIRAKYYDDFKSITDDDTLANFYIESNNANHIFARQDNSLYTYFKKKWKKEGIGHGLMKLMIHDQIADFACELNKKTTADINALARGGEKEDSEFDMLKRRQKNINDLIKKINNVAKINSVEQRILHYLAAEEHEVEFDGNPQLFAFRNCVFNLEIGRIVEAKREDYILNDTGYNYTEADQKKVRELREILDTIFPDRDIRNTYLHTLATAITGYNPEKFVIASGGGRNGKGVLNELFEDMLGQAYFYTAPSELLLNSKKNGASPELANMNNKRCVVFREPEASKRINTAFCKELTGGKAIAGRTLYSADMLIQLKATFIMECNDIPLLSGKIGQAEAQRFVDIPFVNTFTNDPNDLKCEGFYPQNPAFKTKKFREDMRLPLFQILLEYMDCYYEETGKYVWEKYPMPKVIADRTKAYIDASDEIKMWIKEALTTVPYTEKLETMYAEKNYITPKEIYNYFKSGEIYSNMSKEEKRKHNESFWKNYISTNLPYRKKYEDRYKNKRSLLFGYNINYGNDEDTTDIDI